MDVTGLCQICESAPVHEQCENCGALVCTDHYDFDEHRCTACVMGWGEDTGDQVQL